MDTLGQDDFMLMVGGRIRNARTRAGMSQLELAKAVGVTRTTISAMETGKAQPSLARLYELAVATGAAVRDLLPPGPLLTRPEVQVEATLHEGIEDMLDGIDGMLIGEEV